jgi:catechol 2,3-dioxygenase-like lactoylglutathione lyase family enzyme
MFSHLSLGVRNLAKARPFYDALLKPLGHEMLVMTEAELAYGPVGAFGQFYLYPVTGDQVAGLGTHVAFAAPTREAVDKAYAGALAHDAEILRTAGPHPDIAADYYGAIVLDPDGNKLEIVAEQDGK